jgi:nucleotide-binding universal stress UspA family protein
MLTQDIRHFASPGLDRAHPVRRVLVAFDGSDGAWGALRRGTEIALTYHAQLTIAGVVGSPPLIADVAVDLIAMPYSRATLQHELDAVMERHLAAARDEIPASISVTTVLLHGRAIRAIARLAEDGGYDLVVTGPRRVTRLGRLLHRSVTRGLLSQGNVSVLAVKAT